MVSKGSPDRAGAWNRSNGEGPAEGQEAPEAARSAGSRSQAVQPGAVPPNPASGAEARTETAAAAPMVLVVEDYADAREMYAEFLRFMGFRVAEARNGEEALARAVEFTPDVVLMDLALPLMDGWEATRRLRSDPRTSQVIIVALTGHALAGHAEGARRAGCDAFVTKPCLPDDLVEVIRGLLEVRQREARRGASLGTAPTDHPVPPAPSAR